MKPRRLALEPAQLGLECHQPSHQHALPGPRGDRQQPTLEAEEIEDEEIVLDQPGSESRLRQRPVPHPLEEGMPRGGPPLLGMARHELTSRHVIRMNDPPGAPILASRGRGSCSTYLQGTVSFGNFSISARCRFRASTSASVSTRSSGSISSPLPKSYWTSTRPSSSGSKPRRSWNSFLTSSYMAARLGSGK